MKIAAQVTHFIRFGRMIQKFIDVLAYGDDFGVQVSFKSKQGFDCVLWVPYRRCCHAEDFGSLTGWQLEVLAHYPVIRVILPGMMTFVKYHQCDLKLPTNKTSDIVYTPVRMKMVLTLSILQ